MTSSKKNKDFSNNSFLKTDTDLVSILDDDRSVPPPSPPNPKNRNMLYEDEDAVLVLISSSGGGVVVLIGSVVCGVMKISQNWMAGKPPFTIIT